MPLSRQIKEEEILDYSRDFLKQHNNRLGNGDKLFLDLYNKKNTLYIMIF